MEKFIWLVYPKNSEKAQRKS